MNTKQHTIGVLGGMGTYATIHLFRQYAEIFPAKKEWERPRIIIDNRCTMPSRVLAATTGEQKEQLIGEMSDSIGNLIKSGCDRILLGCNTAHLFLPEIFAGLPEAEGMIVNMIETCVEGLAKDRVDEVFLLASEGTTDSGIYQKACGRRGIRCRVLPGEDYVLLRECIEAVKTNAYSDHVGRIFSELIHRGGACVLGCTELPVLYQKYAKPGEAMTVYDPVSMALMSIKEEYQDE